jgi:L-ascorbate metabolism protein UlaG (beta-lactamase superfamily)
LAYTAYGNGGLLITENSLSGRVNVKGHFVRETPYDETQNYIDVAINNGYAYLTAYDGADNGVFGLEILDVSDVNNISLTSFTEIDKGILTGIYYVNGYAYVGGENGIAICNVANPNSVTQTFHTLPPVKDIVGKDNYLYVGVEGKLIVFDISSPGNLSEIKVLTDIYNPQNMYVDGDYLYIANFSEFIILDIGNPASPVIVSSKPYYTKVLTSVCAKDDFAVIGFADENLLEVFDVSDKTAPSPYESIHLTGVPISLAVDNNDVAVGLEAGHIKWYSTGKAVAYLPHITSTSSWSSYLIVDNITNKESSVTVELFSNSSFVSETTYSIAPGEQKKIELNVEGVGKVYYMKDEVVLKETFKSADEGIAEFTLSDSSSSTIYFLLPQYNADNLTWSGLAIMNPDDSEVASLTVTGYDENGTVLKTVSGTLAPNAKLVGFVSTFLPNVDFADVSKIKVTSNVALTGITISGYENERLLFSKAQGNVFSGDLPISHIAAEINDWKNIIIMDNVSSNTANVNIKLYKAGQLTDTLNYTINGNGTKYIDLSDIYTTTSIPDCGFVSVGSNQVFVRESFIFKSSDGGTAEFVLTNRVSDSVVYNFPNYFSESIDWLGLSVFNTFSIEKQFNAKAYNKLGEEIGQTTVTLSPYSRYVALVNTLFPSVPYSQVARIVVEGECNIAGINISGSGHSRLLFTPAFQTGTVRVDSGDNGDGGDGGTTADFIDTIHHIYHAGVWIEYNDMNIFIDPVNITGIPSRKADIIFITHPYDDHLDLESIAKIAKVDTTIVIPSVGLDYLSGYNSVLSVEPDNSYTVKGISFKTIKAYNARFSGGTHFEALGFVGYFIELGANSVYHAGDTDHIDEMTGLNPTVALLPVGGAPEVMTPNDAAEAAIDINPEIAVPIHYDLYGSESDAYAFQSLLEGKVEVRILSNEQP